MPTSFTPATIPFTDPELVNPGRGEYLWQQQPKDPAWWPDLVDEYTRDAIAWTTVEPTQGVYDFTVIEQRLAAAAARGGRFGFRVMPMLGIDETRLAPSWVPMTTVNGHTYPDWNNPAYITAWTSLLTAIGDAFNGDPRLWFMDISGAGTWGEYTWDDAWGPFITDANANTIGQAAVSAFPDSTILAPALRPYMDSWFELSPRVGWRFDYGGCMELTLDGNPPIEHQWKTAPMVIEWGPNPAAWSSQTAWNNVRDLHASAVSSGNHPVKYADMTQADQALFVEAIKRSGYRYSLTSLTVDDLAAEQSATVSTTWTNAGSAPTYESWRVDLVLRKADTGTEWSAPLTGDLRSNLGRDSTATWSSQVTPPAGMSGWYDVGVRVVDPRGYLPPMRLATAGRDTTGTHFIGTVHVDGRNTTMTLEQNLISAFQAVGADIKSVNSRLAVLESGGNSAGVISTGPYTLDPRRTPAGSVTLLPAGTTVLTHVGNRFTGTPAGQTPSASLTALSGSLALRATGATPWKFADTGLFGESIQLTTTATATDMAACTADLPAGVNEVQISVVCVIPEPTADTGIIAVYRNGGAQEFRALIKPGSTGGTANIIFDDSKTAGGWNHIGPNYPAGSRLRIAIALQVGTGTNGRQKGAVFIVNQDGSETQVGTTYEVTGVTTPATDTYALFNFGKLTGQASLESKVLQLDSVRVAYGPGAYDIGFLTREQLYPEAV